MLIRVAVLTGFSGLCVGTTLAQAPWVVPPANATAAGTGSANFIYNAAARTYQFSFPGSDFATAPALVLTGMTHRLRSTVATSWPPVDAVFTNYDVYIGELANTTGVLSGTFAENIVPGTDVHVRSGPLTIPAGSATSDGTLPNPFSTHVVNFQQTFTVDTARNYIVTVRHTGHNTTTLSWDRLLSGGLYAGRSASTYDATTGGTLANWTIPQFFVVTGGSTCYPNCDQSTVSPILNVADFTCFLQRFAAGESYANCDQSTEPPVLNVADFTCFLQQFAAGCP